MRCSHSESRVNHICQQISYKVIMDVGTPSGCLISVRLLLFKKGEQFRLSQPLSALAVAQREHHA